MVDKAHYWRNRELREHVAVIDEKLAPTLVLKNSVYLNTYINQWLDAHIWIYKDRIVYVGKRLPKDISSVEVVDCEGKFLVPGYIESNAYPFQLYTPEELGHHAAIYGTTTLVNDNLMWHFLLDRKKAFTLLERMSEISVSMYWWARYNPDTALKDEGNYFDTEEMLAWFSHPSVVQGGEITAWPRLLSGDDRLLYWIQETKRLGKPVEGHFPGASEATLTKMKLLGVNGDHESMTGKDVMKRLQLGYQVSLRHSSIRPDLPKLITEIMANDIRSFDLLTMTTDGSTPSFYEEGLMNICIDIAIKKGVPIEDAYRMATYNVAVHFGMADKFGSIGPGKVAHINILDAKDNPHPVGVLAKGAWIVKDEVEISPAEVVNWEAVGLTKLKLDWDVDMSDLQFSVPIGLSMVNDVVIKASMIELDSTVDTLSSTNDTAFLVLIDRAGKWRVNTTIRGFTNRLGAVISSYSMTGDIVIIGKDKQDMLIAWQRMKALGGAIVLVDKGEVIYELPLTLGGVMFDGKMRDLIEREKALNQLLKDYGYRFNDPIYSIFILSSAYLPYIRVTQQGIIDVKRGNVLFPATMR